MSLFGDIVHGIENTVGGRWMTGGSTAHDWDSIEGWLTGSSAANRQYRYQSYLQDAQQGFNAQEAQKAFERERQLQKEERDWTKNYFDYVANYNTPASQMARLKAAGLNPNLVYGNGAQAIQAAVSGGPAGSAPQASASTGGASGGMPGNLAGVIGSLTGLMNGISQLKQTKAQTDLLDQKTEGERLQNVTRIFGDGFIGDIARVAVGMKHQFPEQYDMIRDWASRQWANLSTKAPSWFASMRKMVDGLSKAQPFNIRQYLQFPNPANVIRDIGSGIIDKAKRGWPTLK